MCDLIAFIIIYYTIKYMGLQMIYSLFFCGGNEIFFADEQLHRVILLQKKYFWVKIIPI